MRIGAKRHLTSGSEKKSILIISVTLLVISLFVGGFVLYLHRNDDAVDLEKIQNDLVEELINSHGEYDESSIVLTGTNHSAAKRLAEKLNAALRITSDGSFATLTLPEGVTFLDIAQSDAYLSDFPRMSIDYHAHLSDIADTDSEDYRLLVPPQYEAKDNLYSQQTYLSYLNMRDVWKTTKGDGITVAIIDSGIDYDHPEFSGRISTLSYNASENKVVKDYETADNTYDWSLIEDVQGHGTAVAGVLAASLDDGEI